MSDHVLVIHRWRDSHAPYEKYLDHTSHRVSYITTGMGRESIPDGAADIVTVAATDDIVQVRRAADQLIARFGAPTWVVALNEGDLDTAAELRDQLCTPGLSSSALARFRDKLIMIQMVAEAGIPTPAFADAPNPAAVYDFAERVGWPVLVKPRRGTASRGVLRLDSARDLNQLARMPAEPRIVEDFRSEPMYHIDGLWTGTQLGPWRASRYLNTCVDFTVGQVLGSVEVDDPQLLPALGEFAGAVAGALSDEPWVFHMEAFVGCGLNRAPELTFLEVGYRVGGAEIPFVWREVHGVDLASAAIDVQLGRTPNLITPTTWRTAGWLLVPTPVPTPCRVVRAELNLAPGEGPYAQKVPPVGYVIPKVGGYEHVGARFRFRGNSTADVEKLITNTASRFQLDCVPEQSEAVLATEANVRGAVTEGNL